MKGSGRGSRVEGLGFRVQSRVKGQGEGIRVKGTQVTLALLGIRV